MDVYDIKGKNYGVVLILVILFRFFNDIRMEWFREGEGKEDDFEFLLDFLKFELERRERFEFFK